MARCSGCADRCTCKIIPGANITVTGSGSGENPYQISATGGASAATIPTGTIWGFGGAVAPAGWLLCTGAAVSRSGFAALFGVIGTTYGPGDSSTTFNLPDLAGRHPMGADPTHPLGSIGGAESVTLAVAQLPAHTHPIAHTHRHDHDHSAASSGTGAHHHDSNQSNQTGSNNTTFARGGSNDRDVATSTDGAHSHVIDVSAYAGSTGGSSAPNSSATGSGNPVPTMDPYTAVSYIIKT